MNVFCQAPLICLPWWAQCSEYNCVFNDICSESQIIVYIIIIIIVVVIFSVKF